MSYDLGHNSLNILIESNWESYWNPLRVCQGQIPTSFVHSFSTLLNEYGSRGCLVTTLNLGYQNVLRIVLLSGTTRRSDTHMVRPLRWIRTSGTLSNR